MDAKLVWMGVLFIVAALLAVLYFVFEGERKAIADVEELDELDMLAWEHEERIVDNRKKLEQLIREIEKNQAPSAAVTARLERARRILNLNC